MPIRRTTVIQRYLEETERLRQLGHEAGDDLVAKLCHARDAWLNILVAKRLAERLKTDLEKKAWQALIREERTAVAASWDALMLQVAALERAAGPVATDDEPAS